MIKNVFLSAAGVLLIMVSSVAHAEWQTKVDDDVFADGGRSAKLLGVATKNTALMFECNKAELSLSYVERGLPDADDFEGITAEMRLKIGDNKAMKFMAVGRALNDKIAQLKTNDAELIKTALSQLKTTKAKTIFGIFFPQIDFKFTSGISSSHSSQAVNQFIETCNIELPEK